MRTLQAIAAVVSALVALTGAGLALWPLWKRRRVEAHKANLLQVARAVGHTSLARLREVPISLRSDFEHLAARELQENGLGSVEGDTLTLYMDKQGI